MGDSLQDQLIKAGLADASQVSKARAGKKHKNSRKRGRRAAPPSDEAVAARKALARKAARDRELNQARTAKAERKAKRAEIRQLIEQHRLPREGAEVGYYFEENRKIRKLFVTPTMHGQLVSGSLAIVKLDGRHDVVPSHVAERIRERDSACIVPRKESQSQPAGDDPYADYKVPDDLMW